MSISWFKRHSLKDKIYYGISLFISFLLFRTISLLNYHNDDLEVVALNIRISDCPDQCSLSPLTCTSGNTIVCSAQGNPSPTYIWMDANNSIIVSYSSTLDGSLLLTGHNYTCNASNNARDGKCNCFISCQGK